MPESLGELKALELQAIGKVTVARDLSNAHPALGQLLKREEQLRSKQAASSYPWDRPLWDGPLGQRQLRIINALFKALSTRGASPWTRYSSGELELWCHIGTHNFQVSFARDPNARGGDRASSRDLPAGTKVSLSLNGRFRSPLANQWEDGAVRLEHRISEIAADLIVAGEASFREALIEARERAEQSARWEEERRQAELKRLREQRLADLKESGKLLRQAGEFRALAEQVNKAVGAGSLNLTASQLGRWRSWVLSEADRIDPVISGQVMSHILFPHVEDGKDL